MNSSVLMALARHDGGELARGADELMKELIRDVSRFGQKGRLTIEIGIEPNGGSALKMSARLKIAKPARPVGEAFYWADADNNLTREPPKDTDMFRVVSDARTEAHGGRNDD